MVDVYLASSAMKDHEDPNLATVQAAKKYGFNGVQLGLSEGLRQRANLDHLTKALVDSSLPALWHLPDSIQERTAEADRLAAWKIAQAFPSSRFLVNHFPQRELPAIPGARVGWKNSAAGVPEPSAEEGGTTAIAHMGHTLEKAYKDKTFIAFEYGLFFHEPDPYLQSITVQLINRVLTRLGSPSIVHATDQTDWTKQARTCPLGQGIAAPLIYDLRRTPATVVLMYEDLEFSIASKDLLKTFV